MKKKVPLFLLTFLVVPFLLFGEVTFLKEKGWGELGDRKRFPSKDFFGNEDSPLGNFLPEKTEYAPPTSLENEEYFLQYTGLNFIPKMRDFFLPGRIVAEKKEGACIFVGGPKGEALYFMREGAVCHVKDRWLSLDIVYSVLRKAKSVRLSKKYLYYKIATVRLKNFVGKKGDYASVQILNSFTEIKEGDILVPYEKFKSVINVVDKKPGVASNPSKIVSFSKEVLDVSGSEDYIFLEHGSDHGFVKGRVYAIHRTNSWEKKFSSPSRYLVDDVMLVGKVLIVEANEAGAVGYVLDAKGELYLGDTVGRPWDVGFH